MKKTRAVRARAAAEMSAAGASEARTILDLPDELMLEVCWRLTEQSVQDLVALSCSCVRRTL